MAEPESLQSTAVPAGEIRADVASADRRADRSRRPRRLQLLVGVFACVGMLAGWWAMARQMAASQSRAVQQIERAGGRVYWDYQWRDGHPALDGKPTQAAWLRLLMGPAYFDRAVAVDLRLLDPTVEIADRLRFLPQLQWVDGRDTNLDDRLLQALTRCPRLTYLDVSQTRISDAGIGHLKRCSQLRTLNLRGTNISQHALNQLAGCVQLMTLDLRDTALSAAGVQRLRQALPRCRIRWADSGPDVEPSPSDG